MVERILLLLSQFADDTNIFLTCNKKTIDAVAHTLARAEKHLGLKTNIEKSTLYRIGSLSKSEAEKYTQSGFAWSQPPIDTLGIKIQLDLDKMYVENMKPVKEKSLQYCQNGALIA